jgi:hypothetical protein
MINHQKQDQEPSWKINFHPAKTLHEKEKNISYENHYIQKKSIKKLGLELQTLGNTNYFLQSLNASSQNIDLLEEKNFEKKFECKLTKL